MEDQEVNQFSELKRQCHQELKTIRKSTREEIYTSRRAGFIRTESSEENETKSEDNWEEELKQIAMMKIVDKRFENQIREIMQESVEHITLQEIVESLRTEDVFNWHFALINLRKMVISNDSFELVQAIIDNELVPGLVQYMARDDFPQLKLESAWIITNLACGSKAQCQTLIFHKAHVKMCDILKRNQPYTTEQAIWGLGNLAVAGHKISSQLVQAGAIEYLCDLGHSTNSKFDREMIIWALSNIIRSSPAADPKSITVGLKFLCLSFVENYYNNKDEYSLHIFSTLMYYTDSKTLLKYYQQGFLTALMAFCKEKIENPLFQLSFRAALGLLGKFSFATVFVVVMINEDLLQLCEKILTTFSSHRIIKDTLFILSNVAGDHRKNVDQLMNNTRLVKIAAKILEEGAIELRYEAAFIFKNAATNASPSLITEIIDSREIIHCIAACMMSTSVAEQLVDLSSCLCSILRLGYFNGIRDNTHNNRYVDELMNVPGIAEWIEEFNYHQNTEVQKAVKELWRNINLIHPDEEDFSIEMI